MVLVIFHRKVLLLTKKDYFALIEKLSKIFTLSAQMKPLSF